MKEIKFVFKLTFDIERRCRQSVNCLLSTSCLNRVLRIKVINDLRYYPIHVIILLQGGVFPSRRHDNAHTWSRIVLDVHMLPN